MPQDLYIYTHEFSPKRGGIATYCHEFATAAASLIDQVVVIGPKGAQPLGEFASAYLIKQSNNQGSHNPSCIWKTSRVVRQNLQDRPTAIHLLAEPGPILAYGMLSHEHSKGRQVHLTLHGSEIERWRSHPISNALARRAFRNAESIQVVSTPILDSLLHAFPETTLKAKVVHNALPEAFRQTSAQQAINPSSVNNSDRMKVLSVGRLHPRKGFDQIIQAIALLTNEEKSRLQYTIAGAAKDRAYLARLKRLAETAGIQIDFQLNLDNEKLCNCYAAADVFALTSMPRKKSVEGFGIVYLEAGAYELPCLAYDAGGVREAVRNGSTGILVETGDVEALSQQLRFFLQHPKTRQQMGKANQRFALSRTWEDVVRETLMEESGH